MRTNLFLDAVKTADRKGAALCGPWARPTDNGIRPISLTAVYNTSHQCSERLLAFLTWLVGEATRGGPRGRKADKAIDEFLGTLAERAGRAVIRLPADARCQKCETVRRLVSACPAAQEED